MKKIHSVLRACTLAVGVIAGSVLSATADPSFECSKATSSTEKTICNDPVLSELDLMISNAYRSFEAEFQPRKELARRLLQNRNSCGDDSVCISAMQLSALETFKAIEPWVRNYVIATISRRAAAIKNESIAATMPRLPGQCLTTRIAAVTTRFGDPVAYENIEQGTAVQYANGGYVVSYDRYGGLQGAEAGHLAVVCLMSIPYDCPTGDDRGRVYYTLDLSTKGEWILPDSQHMCGGA